MRNVTPLCCVVAQLIIMYFSGKMRQDAINRSRAAEKMVESALALKRCAQCSHWYAHPENEGHETDCPFKYHPRDVEYCSCWNLRGGTEC